MHDTGVRYEAGYFGLSISSGKARFEEHFISRHCSDYFARYLAFSTIAILYYHFSLSLHELFSTCSFQYRNGSLSVSTPKDVRVQSLMRRSFRLLHIAKPPVPHAGILNYLDWVTTTLHGTIQFCGATFHRSKNQTSA